MTNINVNQDKASLYKKVLNVMGKVERVKKDSFNSFHKYAYTSESMIVDTTRKLMVEEGLVLFNNVREYEINGELATVTVDFTLCDVDTGESISTCIIGQGTDRGDKAFYKAYSGATKYYLMKTFLIPTGDDPEADATTDERAYGNRAASSDSSNGQPKPVTGKQLAVMYQKIRELVTVSNQSKEVVIQSLKKRVGEFESLEKMNSSQASQCIQNLTKWHSDYTKEEKQ